MLSETNGAVAHAGPREHLDAVGEDVLRPDLDALPQHRAADHARVIADPRARGDDALLELAVLADDRALEDDGTVDPRVRADPDVRAEHGQAADVGVGGDLAARADVLARGGLHVALEDVERRLEVGPR